MNNFCPNCGSPTTADSAFCANCGQNLASTLPPSPPPTSLTPGTPAPYVYPQPGHAPATSTSSGRGLRPLVLVVASVGLLIGGLVITLVVLLSGDSGSPEDAVEDYIAASNSGDCDRLVELTYFDENSDQTESELREDCSNPNGLQVDYEILDTEDKSGDLPSGVSDAAAVRVRVTAEFDGSKQSNTSTVTVYKVDGDWLLYDDGGNSDGSSDGDDG